MSLLTNRYVQGLTVLGCFTLVGLVGCSSQPQNFDELTAAEKTQAEHLESLQSWIFPPSEAESARRAFVERCVAEAGGSYKEPEVGLTLESAVYTGRTTEELKTSGYGKLPAAEGRPAASFNQKGLDAYLGEGGETFTVTFMDYSSGELDSTGCMAQSYEYIYGSAEDGVKAALLAPEFAQAIETSLRTDENYLALQESWGTCMSEAGFSQVSSTDEAAYAASLLNADDAKGMLKADISCRENMSFDSSVADLKSSYYESVYKRLEQFSKDLEGIHATAVERTASDKTDPKNTSPVTVPTPTASPTAS
ncbi:hypothetical protein [Rothia sp. 88186D007BW]